MPGDPETSNELVKPGDEYQTACGEWSLIDAFWFETTVEEVNHTIRRKCKTSRPNQLVWTAFTDRWPTSIEIGKGLVLGHGNLIDKYFYNGCENHYLEDFIKQGYAFWIVSPLPPILQKIQEQKDHEEFKKYSSLVSRNVFYSLLRYGRETANK